jgi:ribonuclease P protein component
MISSTYRFHGQNGLLYVYRKGQTIRTKHCAAKFVTNTRRDSFRVGVVVSKKSAKAAPIRNRIRRRIYEQVRLYAPKYLTNQDVVITVFDQDLAIAPAQEIEQLILRILKSIRSLSK